MKNLIMKIIIALIVVISIIGIIIGVNGKTKEENKNVFIMGLDDSFPPMGFRNENNEIVGFDIDLAKAVCEKLGMELRLQQISWASKEQELNSGNVDCIWNGFAYNQERAETMTLTEPYIKGEMVFLVKNGTAIKSQEELKGKKIGVQTGSTGQLDLEESEFGKEVEILQYGDYLTSFMDLETGNIDAVFAGSIVGNYLIKSKNKDYITIKSENISRTNGNVIAFKKGNTELRDKVQNALYELKKEGTLKEISEKWFGTDMIIVEEK